MDEPSITPGWQSSEFKSLLVYFLTAIAATIFHRSLGPQITAVVDAGVPFFAAFYALSRGAVKAAHADAVANFKSAQLRAENESARLNAEFPPQ